MYRPLLLVIAGSFLLLTPVRSRSEEMRVYQWTDSQGVVHYSQFEPEKIHTLARDLHSRSQESAVDATPKTKEELFCDTAKANRDLLAKDKGGRLTQGKDSDGKAKVMTDEEIKAAKDQTELQIKTYCKS